VVVGSGTGTMAVDNECRRCRGCFFVWPDWAELCVSKCGNQAVVVVVVLVARDGRRCGRLLGVGGPPLLLLLLEAVLERLGRREWDRWLLWLDRNDGVGEDDRAR
jgi:hypothetical protein